MLTDALTKMKAIMNIENSADFLLRKQDLKHLFSSLETQIKKLNITKAPHVDGAEDVALAVR